MDSPGPGAGPLRIFIVDDEALARLRLRSLLQACTETPTEVVAEAEDAQTALDKLRSTACDLMLLDIRMPGRDGLQLASALRTLPAPPAVVFVTAHAGHALRAFDLDAVDYDGSRALAKCLSFVEKGRDFSCAQVNQTVVRRRRLDIAVLAFDVAKRAGVEPKRFQARQRDAGAALALRGRVRVLKFVRVERIERLRFGDGLVHRGTICHQR